MMKDCSLKLKPQVDTVPFSHWQRDEIKGPALQGIGLPKAFTNESLGLSTPTFDELSHGGKVRTTVDYYD